MGTKGLFIVDDEGNEVASLDLKLPYETVEQWLREAREGDGKGIRASVMLPSGQYVHLHIDRPRQSADSER